MPNDAALRNQTALLVLRVWMERGSVLPLRAYIRQTTDISLGFESATVETDVDAAVDSVRTWLQDLLDEEFAGGDTDPRVNGNGSSAGNGSS